MDLSPSPSPARRGEEEAGEAAAGETSLAPTPVQLGVSPVPLAVGTLSIRTARSGMRCAR